MLQLTPLTLIGEAVFARCLSALKDERVAASKVLSGPKQKFSGDKKKDKQDKIKGMKKLTAFKEWMVLE